MTPSSSLPSVFYLRNGILMKYAFLHVLPFSDYFHGTLRSVLYKMFLNFTDFKQLSINTKKNAQNIDIPTFVSV